MKLVRKKQYQIRRVGVRGGVVGVPTAFMDRWGLGVGSPCYLLEDEKGNLVVAFEHSPDFKRMEGVNGEHE